MKVAVVGAGLAGLACARELAASGVDVRVFEKSRGVGGRLATRRAEPYAFDHGAQYFTVRSEPFAAEVDRLRAAGVVARWDGRVVALRGGEVLATSPCERYVGVPEMSAIGRALAGSLAITHDCRAAHVTREGTRWQLADELGTALGAFDCVVAAVPAAQAVPLLAAAPALATLAKVCDIAPCWAVMVAFHHRLPLDFDGAFVEDAPLAWIMRNGSKPGRPGTECWVLHASAVWSREHLEQDKEAVVPQLLDAFAQVTGVLAKPGYAVAHRWRYALPEEPLTQPFLLDAGLGLAACGDWCGGPRVEGAYLSGLHLGQLLAQSATQV